MERRMKRRPRLSRFVGVRVTPEQANKLLMLSHYYTDEPGNMSAAVRWAVDSAAAEMELCRGRGQVRG